MEYREDEFLLLSGIQHFLFCKRQWALIHIEQLWADNLKTVEGELMHQRAHDPEFSEKRNNILIVRAMKVHSFSLGISGECDVVEFMEDDNGIKLANREKLWLPYPIEYKRGHSKPDDSDRAQLCAQAMCLEEMLCCDIAEGAIYYGELHHRESVRFTEELRSEVKNALKEMHIFYKRGHTPIVKAKKGCRSCSMMDLCLPDIQHNRNVMKYMKMALEDS